MRYAVCGAIALVLSAVPASSVGGRPDTEKRQEPTTYSRKGSEAPVQDVVESFLMDASAWFELPEDYPAFCQPFSIDADWPSAGLLGTVGRQIQEEYHRRVMSHDPQGVRWEEDPNEWKLQEVGRAFGEVFEALRGDGLRLRLEIFLRVVELHTRPTFTTYSDQPFDEERETLETEVFWQAMAETSGEAAEILQRGKGGSE